MIDEIFKIRFVEEIASILKVKDKKTKLKLRLFAVLSFILALFSTYALSELIVNAIKHQDKRYFAYFIVIIILAGFAVTFLLTFAIFAIAYKRDADIRGCLKGLKISVDKDEVLIGGEISLDIGFHLIKHDLKEIRLVVLCTKETLLQIINQASVKTDKPYIKEYIIADEVVLKDDEYSYDIKLKIPDNALKSQEVLAKGKDRVSWCVTVHFDFKDWRSYEERITLRVV